VTNPVPVLLYHSISSGPTEDAWQVRVADFAADMEAVARSGRTCVTASDYSRWMAGTKPLPAAPVLVTFDDGYADFVDLAMPVLTRLGLTATLFVSTGYVDQPGMVSAAALRDLAGTPVEIGAHSVHHRHLDNLPERQAGHEIRYSRRDLEDVLGTPVGAFAYPYGSHRAGTKRLVAGDGYRTAHAVKNALSHRADDPYAVARFTVRAQTSRSRVQAVLDGYGAPLAWPGERLRTRAYRVVRHLRERVHKADERFEYGPRVQSRTGS
jgi:peptidoglycan/xylan/chitin deacetylase (PgdA/CDA1 family)